MFGPQRADEEFNNNLLGSTTPFIVVIEAVHSRGWQLAQAGEVLPPLAAPYPAKFSRTNLANRMKPYFRASSLQGDLWNKGMVSLGHTETSKYYLAVLISERPADIPVGATSKIYEGFLAKSVGIQATLASRRDALDGVGSDDEAAESDAEQVTGLVLAHAKAKTRCKAAAGVGSASDPSSVSATSSSTRTS